MVLIIIALRFTFFAKLTPGQLDGQMRHESRNSGMLELSAVGHSGLAYWSQKDGTLQPVCVSPSKMKGKRHGSDEFIGMQKPSAPVGTKRI